MLVLHQPNLIIRILSIVRLGLAFVLMIALGVGKTLLGIDDLPVLIMWQIILCLVFVNFLVYIGYRKGISPPILVTLGLIADSLFLTELLYFTGGADNPLTVLYIAPIICAALYCRPLFAWALSFSILLIYLLLFFWYEPLELFNLHSTHLAGMWITFSVTSIFLMAGISTLIQLIKQSKERLNQAYRKQQEDEYWLVLGMEASSLAHELSTPMNTLMLLQNELASTPNLPEQTQKDIAALKVQLDACKNTLDHLKYKIQPSITTFYIYAELKNRLKRWHNLRPDSECVLHQQDTHDYLVTLDESFWSAFFNILNNAADAANDEAIDLYSRIHHHTWEITIHNKNGNLSADQLSKAGLDIIDSDKPFGMGLGVRLAHATLSRLRGTLTLSNYSSGGVQAKISLPLVIHPPM